MIRARFYTVPKVTDNVALRAIAKGAGGYTIFPASGGWIDSYGTLIEEASSVLEVVADDVVTVEGVERLVRAAAFGAGELSVLVTRESVRGRFVDTTER